MNIFEGFCITLKPLSPYNSIFFHDKYFYRLNNPHLNLNDQQFRLSRDFLKIKFPFQLPQFYFHFLKITSNKGQQFLTRQNR